MFIVKLKDRKGRPLQLGDEIENPEFDENSPYRWRTVTDQHIGIEIRFIENRIRRQYFPKHSVNAV